MNGAQGKSAFHRPVHESAAREHRGVDGWELQGSAAQLHLWFAMINLLRGRSWIFIVLLQKRDNVYAKI